jgi:GMP synthase (glutamine-hydrolysing)
LLVSCELKIGKSQALSETVGKFSQFTVVPFRDITETYHIPDGIDAIVLSGSAARIVEPAYQNMFRNVANLIKTCNVPILGICYGHQLLCWAFGAKVGSLPQRVFNFFGEIRVIEADGLFTGLGRQVLLSENHFDYVLKDGLAEAGFVLLADSASCEVEAIKHKTKPFYGVQFHPERTTERYPEGQKVIENFYKNAVKPSEEKVR